MYLNKPEDLEEEEFEDDMEEEDRSKHTSQPHQRNGWILSDGIYEPVFDYSFLPVFKFSSQLKKYVKIPYLF